MFWHGQGAELKRVKAELSELQAYYGQLHGKLAQIERDLADVHADLLRWMKRERERARRDGRMEAEQSPNTRATAGPSPPPDLRGARLRIWQRKHGGPNGLDHGAPSEAAGDVSSPESDATP